MTLEHRYLELVDVAVESFGSLRQVSLRLGLGHNTLHQRISRKSHIREEHLHALEALIARYKPKYSQDLKLCSCGGTFRHKHYSHDTSAKLHWETLRCSGCERMMVVQVLKTDD
jgi:hypothetical protein